MKAVLACSEFHRIRWLSAVLVVLGTMGMTLQARAALILTVVPNGGSPIVVNDNGAGDSNSAPNTINWQSTAISGLTISLITGVSDNPGNSIEGSLSQTQVDITNSSLSTVTIVATLNDTGFTNPLGVRSLLSNISTTFTGVLTGNSASLLSTANSTSTPLQTLTTSGSDSKTVAFPDAGTYSLQNQTTVVLAAGATAIVTDSTTVVPEPASFAMIGAAISGLMMARRRR